MMSISNQQSQIGKSSRIFNPGDVILKIYRPLVHVTKYEHRLFTCDDCFESNMHSSVVCPSCRKVYYCSKKCQRKAWHRLHHLECPILSRHPQMEFENQGIDYMQRLTLRLYLLSMSNTLDRIQSNEEDDGDSYVLDDLIDLKNKPFKLEHNGQTRTIGEMEAHQEQLKDTDYFRGIMNYFKFYKIENIDQDLLLRCYGLLHVNSFGIDCYDSADQTIRHCGTGLYVEASVFDHNCVPNACASGDGLMLEIRALSSIQPGDEIYLDYVQDILPRQERIKILQDRYFFTCQCPFGCDPTVAGTSKAFDQMIDFQRYRILEKLIETIGQKSMDCKDTKRSFDFRLQRLKIQEQYYHIAKYHPCLSLYYQSFLKFLIINHGKLDEIEPEINRLLPKVKEHLSITHGKEHKFYKWNVMKDFF